MLKKIFRTSRFVLFIFLALAFSPINSYAQGSEQPMRGEPAPLFKLETLQGDTLALASLRGKFVVIHFATSW